MSDPMVKTEDIETTHLPTPPHSEHGDTKENENTVQDNTFETNLVTALSNAIKDNTTKEANLETTPSKKRGRPKSTDKSGTPNKPKKSKPEPKEKKPSTAKGVDASKSKRGRQPGSTAADSAFTKEQDAYIRELFTSPEKLSVKDICAKFEEKYNTGRSSNVIRFRWYKMKDDAIVLTEQEETALKKAIEVIETNKAQAVLNEYGKGGDSFTKLSQAFVSKKMKEWATEE
ncbi:hypothetical protein TWF281_011314 [Arthrobotrys megalospora]